MRDMLKSYLTRWNLVPDGAPIITPAAHLLPVLKDDRPAMLKLSHEAAERHGGVLMEWWGGDGVALVFARDGDALLIERATGPGSLSNMARSGHDDEACGILCKVAARLHAPRQKSLPEPTPLQDWFRDLWLLQTRGASASRRASTTKTRQ